MPVQLDTVMKGGTVILPDGEYSLDIGVKDGRITLLEADIDPLLAEKVMDCAGKVLMPGAVDIHVHFNEPGLGSWEGFATGSAALAAGGCTTYVDMPLNGVPPTVDVEAFEVKRSLAESDSRIDFALWGGLVPGNRGKLAGLYQAGVPGFKAFMSEPGGEGEDIFARADDMTLLAGMQEIARLGGMLALHAESDTITSLLSQEMRQAPGDPIRNYLASRPVAAEVEAVGRALAYARITGCRLHFVHISSREALELIRDAKARGMAVTSESCPHYLCLNEEDAVLLGAAAKCAPPIRSEEEQARLWEALQLGLIDVIASDHSPCPPEMKKTEHYFDIWGGISGAQSTMLLMLEEGYRKRGIALHRLAAVLSANPAVITGLDYCKGSIAVGKDADIAVIDMTKSYRLTAEELLYRHTQSPYLGRSFSCSISAVFCRGERVYTSETGVIPGAAGRYIPSRLSQEQVRGDVYV
ncbi:allantoinase AllB [Paenibacillus sp. JX-17]|uniref:Allantoinase n=1 Tax=Paenibacillus lacisoli TaxID=3064525 RepID=A0ABT9C8K3_9BACL|nr:allantoinase AllB [Paenibacillus sp. JX-17]MDO7905585.1 allantoinase AllB [Paenibacillus sp. JX-17]